MKLKIIHVDHNGYNGRDYPPAPADVGLVVLVIGLQVDVFKVENGEQTLEYLGPAVDGGQAAFTDVTEDHLDYCWTCLTEDKRTLELMDHEVEVVK